MVLIGDLMGALVAVIAILGVLLACYGGALLVSHRASRPRPAQKDAQPAFTDDALKVA